MRDTLTAHMLVPNGVTNMLTPHVQRHMMTVTAHSPATSAPAGQLASSLRKQLHVQHCSATLHSITLNAVQALPLMRKPAPELKYKHVSATC
jgi:hypothetical protein